MPSERDILIGEITGLVDRLRTHHGVKMAFPTWAHVEVLRALKMNFEGALERLEVPEPGTPYQQVTAALTSSLDALITVNKARENHALMQDASIKLEALCDSLAILADTIRKEKH